jgi:Na+/melibiose symporter-like transporter
MAETAPPQRRLTAGPGRVLTFFYGVLAVAATGRSTFQLATKFHEAPTAYTLSAVAAVIYVGALWAIIAQARLVAVVACSIEFIGVAAVGTWSYAVPPDFPDTTVWSGYGSGYGYLPAVLPILALLWLRKASQPTAAREPFGPDGPGLVG